MGVRHYWYGSCAPGKDAWPSQATFSVGIFQLVPRANGIGTKRGTVLVRVRGYLCDHEAVYAKASEIVDQLDAGTYTGPKTVSVQMAAQAGEEK